MKIKKKLLWPFFLVLVLFIFLYPITDIYFLQDRWLTIGNILVFKSAYLYKMINPFFLFFGDGRILARILTYLVISLNPFSAVPTMYFALFFHILNSVLIFYLASKLSKNSLISFLAALFFGLNAVSHGSFTWPAAVIVSLPSVSLILASMLIYFSSAKRKGLTFFILAYLAFLFKEIGVFIFIMYPLGEIILHKQRIVGAIKKSWFFLSFVFLTVFARLLQFKSIPSKQALYLTGSSESYFATLITRIFAYPLTAFSQSVIPQPFVEQLARKFIDIYYPFVTPEQYVLLSQSIVSDLISLLFSFLFVFLFFLYFAKKTKKHSRLVVWFLVFSFLSFTPYAIVSKTFSYLDSRFYYLGLVGVVVSVSLVISEMNRFRKFVLVLTAILIGTHTFFLHSEIIKLKDMSQERVKLVSQFKELVPILNENKNVFLIKGDTDYYLVGHHLPLQQGVGYTLMTLYYDSGKIPDKLMIEQFLYELGSQGYREEGNYGFGYFSDKDKFYEFIENNSNLEENTIILYYDSDARNLEIREEKTK